MGNRTKTVTVIGAGNAVGSQVPPFFIFPGQRMMPELMKGQTPEAAGTVTASGWSNAEVFREYLQDHFMKYVQGRDSSEPILILYDGHRSHFSLDQIEWAKTNNMILFVLPPHCSHILQPMDVGCFGPLQIKYSQECQTFSRCNGRMVSRYDVCALACKAYSAALTPANLRAAFAKSEIFPVKCASEMIAILQSKSLHLSYTYLKMRRKPHVLNRTLTILKTLNRTNRRLIKNNMTQQNIQVIFFKRLEVKCAIKLHREKEETLMISLVGKQ